MILAVDTALGACSAALVAEGETLAHEHLVMVRGHAEALAPMVDALMRGAGVSFAALDRIAVTTGPGTFTGQRVGLAFARALGLGLKRPVIGVTTLDAMAQEALEKRSDIATAFAVADAKRGEIYLGGRSISRGALMAPELIQLEASAKRIVGLAPGHGPVLLAGTAADSVRPLLEQAGLQPLDSLVRQPDAVFVARLAADTPESPPPKPLYLRAPDAKLPGDCFVNASRRVAPSDDAALLASLHRQCFADAWDEASFRSLLAGQGVFALTAKDASATESQAFILIQAAAGQSEILSIGTLPGARRSGFARILLGEAAAQALARKAQEMFLEVAEDNAAALALYTGAGFATTGRRRLYYRRPNGLLVDALTLRSPLPLRGHGNDAPSPLR